MGPGYTHSGHRALLSALAAAGLSCLARADLAPASPFLPAGSQAADAASGPSGPIELRGVIAMQDGTAYCIYDVAKKRTTWVGMNEAGHDFVVKKADPEGDAVMVDYQGRVLRLTLHKSKVASSGTAPAPGAPGNPPGAITSTVVLNPSPADEQRRLDAVAQEVRRRRLEREKAAQGPGGGPPSVPNR